MGGPAQGDDYLTILKGMQNQGIPRSPAAFTAARNPMAGLNVGPQITPPGARAPMPPLLSDSTPRTMTPVGRGPDFVNRFLKKPDPAPTDPNAPNPNDPNAPNPNQPLPYIPDPSPGGF